MLTRLYQWMLAKAAHRHADRWLAVISFMESSFFPIPPDVLLAPMCLSQPKRAFYYAFVCTAASVLGALLGYAIGYFLFDTIGQAILDFYGLGDKFSAFSDNFNEQGWLIVFLAGFTPLPFKVITIAAGVTAMPLYVLIGASIVSRGARFFLEAALLWKFGEPMKRLIDRHFGLITTIGGILLVGGFIALRYLGGSHEAESPPPAPTVETSPTQQ
ncbi:MAG: YqaA family protein [Sphingobium sp.]|jgi:membrane protein YqaA with SNARE-associated domain|nr:DedA family protein [Sphingobium sp.]MCP5398324.1 DedA family protein [Sphingomonas sp.]